MSVWLEIKNKLSVEEVIGEYINVESSGANYRCICPFHSENTPSMMISPVKQIWHCFGCGAGGDIFKFVEDYENLTKQETLQKLAKKAGVKLEDKHIKKDKRSQEEISTYNQGLKLLDWSKNTFHRILLNTLSDRKNPLTQYCLKRGLDQNIIETFQIGYAPKQNFIIALADKYNLDKSLLFDIGILGKNKSGYYKDKFIDRLMIPIFNQKENTVGFTGRVLPWDTSENRPKYLNSPQNEWFNKSEIWFGLNLAKNEINKTKTAILVEGNMDVVASYNYGLKNTIASQGTSFTTNQLQILKRFTKNIQIAFDNDNAGNIAGQKLYNEASRLGFEINKFHIPKDYKDIDEYLQTKPEISELESTPYLDWYIKTNNLNFISTNSQIQKQQINEFLDLLINLDSLSKEQYIKKISKLTEISIGTLDILLREKIQKQPKITKSSQVQGGAVKSNPKTDSQLNNRIRVSFQKLIAAEVNSKDLSIIYDLLKYQVPEFEEFNNFDNYLSNKQQEIDLLKENDQNIKDKSSINSILSSLQHILDQNIHKFILDEDLKEKYLLVKNIRI